MAVADSAERAGQLIYTVKFDNGDLQDLFSIEFTFIG
jgi:hypothetical protein